jgi:hypothetical protein
MPNGRSPPCPPTTPASSTRTPDRADQRPEGTTLPGHIAVTNRHDAETKILQKAGAHLVLEPFQDAADQAVQLLAREQKPERLAVEDAEGQKEIAK